MTNFEKYIGVFNTNISGKEQWYFPLQDKQTANIILHDWFNGIRPELLEFFKEKNGNVIQAGGNFGIYPVLYTEFFQTVYTFEPDPLNFFCLNLNCQHENIIKINTALGDINGNCKMVIPSPVNLGMNQIKKCEESTNSIPIVTIDSFQFNDVKLIQLDLEGYEYEGILGAIETINKHKPLIILETTKEASHFEKINNILNNLNYEPYKQITRLDTIFKFKG